MERQNIQTYRGLVWSHFQYIGTFAMMNGNTLKYHIIFIPIQYIDSKTVHFGTVPDTVWLLFQTSDKTLSQGLHVLPDKGSH